MKKRMLILLLIILIFFSGAIDVFAQRGTAGNAIRLASPLPRNSDWGRALDRLAAEWQRIVGNQFTVTVSHDGREGSELTMLSSLSSNSIQAAVLSTVGLAEICPAVMTLSVPFLIRTNDELDRVLREVKPILERQVRNDFIVIAWSKGGWVYVFSHDPVTAPDDLRRQRLATAPELRELNVAFREMRFNVVEVDWTQLGTRLASNTVNAIYMIPAAIAPMNLHRYLGNIMQMPIAPVMGAIVINRVTWERLSQSQQQGILRSAQNVAAEFDASMPAAERNAITSMSRTGLRVNTPTSAQENLWRNEINAALPQLLGTTFDRDMYQRINRILGR